MNSVALLRQPCLVGIELGLGDARYLPQIGNSKVSNRSTTRLAGAGELGGDVFRRAG